MHVNERWPATSVVGCSEGLNFTWGRCTQLKKIRNFIAATVERDLPRGSLFSLTRWTSMWIRKLSSAGMAVRTDITTRAICFTTRKDIMAVHSNQLHDCHRWGTTMYVIDEEQQCTHTPCAPSSNKMDWIGEPKRSKPSRSVFVIEYSVVLEVPPLC